MYQNSSAKIKFKNILSRTFNIEKGTEQGHPLSPELFKIFIRDISLLLSQNGKYPTLHDTTINHLLWADDLVLLSLDEHSLQKNLNVLETFCVTWGLEVNVKKTKIVNYEKK